MGKICTIVSAFEVSTDGTRTTQLSRSVSQAACNKLIDVNFYVI